MLVMVVAMNAKTETLRIQGAKGKLAAIIETPEIANGEKVPMVIICHGLIGNKNEDHLKSISEGLCEHNIASVRFDFNGHGESEGAFKEMTVVNEIEDALKVYEYVSHLDYVSDIAIMGHSQGGVVASMTAGELGSGKIAAVLLLAPAAVLREDFIRGNIMNTTFDPLDPPETVQTTFGVVFGKAYFTTGAKLPIYSTAKRYQGPACMIHGTGDTVVPYTYSLRYHEIWPDSQVHLIDGANHVFVGHIPTIVEMSVNFFVETLSHKDQMAL